MSRPLALRLPALVGVAAVAMSIASCSTADGGAPADATTVAVESNADTCDVSSTVAPAGTVVFEVANTGDDVTEFYLYAADGETIVGEVEDIGPGLSRDLTVDLDAGDYVTACKPGMVGEGIRGDFAVTG